ncbi:citrate transporter [Virgibacillus pantothenticus]|uniref:CitMHS family transporter n=1 Tax=Virgibacillus pantothenticus TaxID=1473 RepID=UPI001B2585A5|nr:citrate:proton symporter [Virgibacillus pantothenticus]MBU8567179.1 citrate:proton symporter [Virgibacillus pantothenticus]MBU8600791.1 citrate:proton symporter [Virgibacillus pantothenticus]MBU8635329.1 citrate:proton symporter [Virgibacillus pantothenticus]MBU8643031.1 citrate:proton symporter [Virgibacillus pantothenticus]MBU8646949.1 citrate:proton symporter [Virgibacillus pantothenticus]
MGFLSIIGFLTIIIIVLLLLSGRVAPIIALVLTPIIGALIAGFELKEIGTFFDDGITDVVHVAIMFIFAILFFGIMQDVGLFDPLIRGMINISQGNIIAISVGSVLIAAIAQLDGSGASTFLITIPALLPLYKKLKMNPYLLLLLIAGSASIMNMLPWAGPLGRSASVLNMDVTELWRPLIPIQVIGLMLMVVLAIVLGYREKKRIMKVYGSIEAASAMEPDVPSVGGSSESINQASESAAWKFWLNVLLTIAVVGTLVWGIIPAGLVFMIGVSLALPLNYPNMEDQMDRIFAHAPNALMMATIILAAGTFLGILTGTGMLDAIAKDVVKVIPAFIAPYIHLIIGFFGVPFDLLLSTDAYYFALMPVVEQIATGFGIDSLSTGYAMIVGNIVGTFISPFSPAVWLALGLAGLEMGRHIRYSLFWLWGLSIVLLASTVAIGLITV